MRFCHSKIVLEKTKHKLDCPGCQQAQIITVWGQKTQRDEFEVFRVLAAFCNFGKTIVKTWNHQKCRSQFQNYRARKSFAKNLPRVQFWLQLVSSLLSRQSSSPSQTCSSGMHRLLSQVNSTENRFRGSYPASWVISIEEIFLSSLAKLTKSFCNICAF